MLGTTVIGINLIRGLETVQLARDAGHMYASTTIDFSQVGNQTILTNIAGDLNLSNTAGSSSGTAGAGSAVVILSKVTYVDDAMCPTGCQNRYQWVLTQRLVIGNPSIHASGYGSLSGVTVDPVTGKIAQSEYTTKPGAVAQFGGTGMQPYKNLNGVISGVPSGQCIYVAEAAGKGFSLPGTWQNAVTYSYGLF
jgi:hypothetical protein